MAQKRNRKINSFTLNLKTEQRIDTLSELLETSKSQIVERAIRYYFKAIMKKQQQESGRDE